LGTLREDAAVDLVNTAPTTLAGIVVAIQYLRKQMELRTAAYLPPEIQAAQWREFGRLLNKLDSNLRPAALCYLGQLKEGVIVSGPPRFMPGARFKPVNIGPKTSAPGNTEA
jgi:hypothetical protein